MPSLLGHTIPFELWDKWKSLLLKLTVLFIMTPCPSASFLFLLIQTLLFNCCSQRDNLKKKKSNEFVSSQGIRGNCPQVSKTQHPRIPVLKQGYNLESFSPSDLDLKLVSTAHWTAVGEEPCETAVLPPPANDSVAPCHKQFVSAIFYHQDPREDVHTH